MKVNIGFVLNGDLTDLVKGCVQQMPDISPFYTEFKFHNIIEQTRAFMEENNLDIVVSAGFNATVMLQAELFPCVAIQTSLNDLLLTLAGIPDDGKPVGLITPKEPIRFLDETTACLRHRVIQRVYFDPGELDGILAELRGLGCEWVIGSSAILQEGRKAGFHCAMIYTCAAVTKAIQEAVGVVRQIQESQRKSEKLRRMMNITYEGIIATDENGTVEIFNNKAEEISGIKAASALGRNIKDVLGNTKLDVVVRDQVAMLNQVQVIGEHEVITNRVPVFLDKTLIGAIATFQTKDRIQLVEQAIRISTNGKGFYAQGRFEDILGTSEAITRLRALAVQYAASEANVLITGETGTGKDIIAQSIHNASRRREAPYVAINCGALPENILESELFGYEEGAFTGAKRGGKMGFFELAHHGTLFLDEIGELSTYMQSRLLRVIENREIMRLGSDRITPIDARIIAATNTSLDALVAQGKFRLDLYYRLNVLRLHTPPLRERLEDVPLLVRHFLDNFNSGMDAGTAERIARHSLLTRHLWPGNVREVRNFCERVSIKMERDMGINQMVLEAMDPGIAPEPAARPLPGAEARKPPTRQEEADALGISRTTLWRRNKSQGK